MVISGFYHNADASQYRHVVEDDVSPKVFHTQLPAFNATPLTYVPKSVSGINHVYIKDESNRLGLPSFKILGASWGTFRSIARKYGLTPHSSFEAVQETAQAHKIHLVTATDGNHGRAIARMANLLGVEATIFVPKTVNEYTRKLIQGEGADVVVQDCDYDATVRIAFEYAKDCPNHLFVQDTSFEGYHEIPNWIVQGYVTMLDEIIEQLRALDLEATHIFTPVGVGSLAHAVVSYCKSAGRAISVVAVESELAACLQTSLRAEKNVPISTKMTIMDGINCGTVSDISWPVLSNGVDAAITISDYESHLSVVSLADIGIDAGPCGASTFAAFRKLIEMPAESAKLGLDQNAVVVLLSTEGSREYIKPERTPRMS